MKITKTITVNTTAEKLWQLIGHNFDQAHLWMDPVPHSFGFGEGESSIGAPMEGRICHLSNNPNGAKAKEVLTHFDDANRSLTFEVSPIDVPAIVPVKKNTVSMTIRAVNEQQAEVIWVSQPQLKLFAYPLYPVVKVGASAAFGKLLKGLKRYAENQPQRGAAIA